MLFFKQQSLKMMQIANNDIWIYKNWSSLRAVIESWRTFSISYPASRLKLYIHEVEAALNTLHHIKWYSLFTRNSQAFGLWRESFPALSKPSSAHFSAKNFLLTYNRFSVSAIAASSINFSSGVRFASSCRYFTYILFTCTQRGLTLDLPTIKDVKFVKFVAEKWKEQENNLRYFIKHHSKIHYCKYIKIRNSSFWPF